MDTAMTKTSGPKYILAYDMGTSGTKSILISLSGDIIGVAKETYPLYHPKPGYAEQDPADWWKACCLTCKSVMTNTRIDPRDVVGITFSSLSQNLIPVTREGEPLYRGITWLDGRAADIMRKKFWTQPRVQGYNVFKLLKLLRITGGAPSQTGKDQIGKLLWLQENEPQVFRNTYKFIDTKDFVIYHLTGNFITSVDVAVLWWLMDTRHNRNQWHPELCRMVNITPDQLSEVRPSAEVVGTLTAKAGAETGLLAGTPVFNGASDVAATAIGAGALDDGEMYIHIGTSSWVAGHFSKRKIDIPHYTGCIGSAYPQKYYLGIAHQETAGACLEWLKNNILYHEQQLMAESQINEIFQLFDQLAEKVGPGAKGVLFTPWMYGERAPLDDDYVRAGLFNLSLDHTREHLVRAVLEGVAFNNRWAMETLEKLYAPVSSMNFIGGGAKSDIWCQIIADITNRQINQISDPQQAGAKGMALLASMTLGYIKSFQEIKNYIKIKNRFIPNPENRTLYDRLFSEYKNIYKHNKGWYKRMNRTPL
jgi:xylulokinase